MTGSSTIFNDKHLCNFISFFLLHIYSIVLVFKITTAGSVFSDLPMSPVLDFICFNRRICSAIIKEAFSVLVHILIFPLSPSQVFRKILPISTDFGQFFAAEDICSSFVYPPSAIALFVFYYYKCYALAYFIVLGINGLVISNYMIFVMYSSGYRL